MSDVRDTLVNAYDILMSFEGPFEGIMLQEGEVQELVSLLDTAFEQAKTDSALTAEQRMDVGLRIVMAARGLEFYWKTNAPLSAQITVPYIITTHIKSAIDACQ